jgi:hypothetical protein
MRDGQRTKRVGLLDRFVDPHQAVNGAKHRREGHRDAVHRFPQQDVFGQGGVEMRTQLAFQGRAKGSVGWFRNERSSRPVRSTGSPAARPRIC